VEFSSPENPNEIFRCDLTWLTPYWNCTFGEGCKGIGKDLAEYGWHSESASYHDKADEARVASATKRLPNNLWQNVDVARKNGKSISQS